MLTLQLQSIIVSIWITLQMQTITIIHVWNGLYISQSQLEPNRSTKILEEMFSLWYIWAYTKTLTLGALGHL